jgi:hypothetical protein
MMLVDQALTESREPAHCGSGHVTAALRVEASIHHNHTKFSQEMQAVH